MKIQFLGGAGTVTGSKTLVEVNNTRVLVDCGLFQGLKDLREKNWRALPVDAKTIDAVILTHAHIDHSGYLPALVKQGFKGCIYATEPTVKLCKLLLRDSAYIQMEDAARANKYGYSSHKPALPLYTIDEAIAVDPYYEKVHVGDFIKLGDEFAFQMSRSGHILGSAFVQLMCQDQKILFSGDLGRESDPILKPPAKIKSTDYLVLESTYGDRLHPEHSPKDHLAGYINKTVERGGTVVIPAFAVERSQMILFYLAELLEEGKLDDIPIYLDSPLAVKSTEIFCRYATELGISKEDVQRLCHTAHFLSTQEESKSVDQLEGPKVIISASGMVTGGRVLHHLKVFGSDPNNMILLTGYQASGTRGEALLAGKKTIKVHGDEIPIKAEVAALTNTSSHADYQEILDWMAQFQPPIRTVFINHGEKAASESLKEKIEATFGYEVIVAQHLLEHEF